MSPPPPRFTATVRLARFSDLTRIGVVAASSFYHSPFFHYERPYYEKYPLDTLSSYRNSFRKAIVNPDAIVLVAEDSFDPDEARDVYESLATNYPPFSEQIPRDELNTGKVIVAVSSFTLLPGSPRHGQFQPEGDHTTMPDDPVSERDMSKVGSNNIDAVLQREESRLFNNRLVIDMIATHPAYWRRGHAGLMMDWIIELAKLDATGLAVTATPMGKMLFTSKGFFEERIVKIPGYKRHPKPIFGWLGLSDTTKERAIVTQTTVIIKIYQVLSSYITLFWPVVLSFSFFGSGADAEETVQARLTKEYAS